MSTAMSKAEQNALAVSYEVLGTRVDLDLQFVKKYLVRGRADLTSDQEVVFFMNTCKMQGLNPLAQGEVYLIKYSKDVLYGRKLYDEGGDLEELRFYLMPMTDEEFEKEVVPLNGQQVYAVHKMK